MWEKANQGSGGTASPADTEPLITSSTVLKKVPEPTRNLQRVLRWRSASRGLHVEGSKGFRNICFVRLCYRRQIIPFPPSPVKQLEINWKLLENKLETAGDKRSPVGLALILLQLSFPCLSWRRANKLHVLLGFSTLINTAPGECVPSSSSTFQQQPACRAASKPSSSPGCP